jgi:enoyl-CoA hydratase/carnithine racemase
MNEILTRTDAGVMTLTINRPERKNALTRAMYAAMADALAQAGTDGDVRVVVLRGSEAVFSAGNDIGDFLDARDATSVRRFISGAATCPKPLIAAVCGPAVGIGTTILAHFDLVYAGDNALFSTPFVDLGLCPEAGSSLLLPQIMGYQRAAAALLAGEPLTAAQALQAGLVNRIAPVAEVHALAEAQARSLAAKPLPSLLETKRLMKAGQSARLAQQIAEEFASFERMLDEPAAREALTAFKEKRKPDFSKL